MSTLPFRPMSSRAVWLVLAALALAVILALASPAQPAAASCGGVTSVGTEAELKAAIAAYNAVNPGPCVFTIQLTADINLTASTTTINNNTSGVSLVIEGNGRTVNGQGTAGVRPFTKNFGQVTINQITITGGNRNSGGDAGGGITATQLGSLTVTNSTITGNAAVFGGGIANCNGPSCILTVQNSTISGNSAGTAGGAIYAVGTVTIDSSTLVNNTNGTLGGALVMVSNTSTITVRNSILANSAGGAADCNINSGAGGPPTFTDGGHNLVETPGNCAASLTGPGTILNQDPALGALADNGGPTQTHLPQFGSPVINAGDTTLTVDQRGIARPQGAADDIGAVEVDTFNLTIVKQTEGGDATFDFGADVAVSPIPNFSLTTSGGTEQQTFSNLAAGEYKIYEGPWPQGWTLKDITCVGVTGDAWSGAFPYAAFTAAPGDNITCTFTNQKLGTINIIKQVTPINANVFSFTDTIAAPNSFSLSHGEQKAFLNVTPGTYTVTEDQPGNAFQLRNISCVDDVTTGTASVGDVNTRTATINLDPGETVTCTFINSNQPLAVTLANFTAETATDGALVAWETVSELENAGFNLYRTATPQTPTAADLLATIPSKAPGSSQGFFYTYEDTTITAGATYWYWLEDVDFSGATTLHEPVSVFYAAPNAVRLRGFEAVPAQMVWPWLLTLLAAALAVAGVIWRRIRA